LIATREKYGLCFAASNSQLATRIDAAADFADEAVRVASATEEEPSDTPSGRARVTTSACGTNYRLKRLLRSKMHAALAGRSKTASTLTLLGCSINALRRYLKKQFAEGMSWDNHGEWHINRIRPCASFDATKRSQQRACFHYSNLQPLWCADNQAKCSRWQACGMVSVLLPNLG
jgi:hypothetical protein